jgi:hypothetical protein
MDAAGLIQRRRSVRRGKSKEKAATTSDGEGRHSSALLPLRRRGGESGMGEVTSVIETKLPPVG